MNAFVADRACRFEMTEFATMQIGQIQSQYISNLRMNDRMLAAKSRKTSRPTTNRQSPNVYSSGLFTANCSEPT